jgi:hypothetical protein
MILKMYGGFGMFFANLHVMNSQRSLSQTFSYFISYRKNTAEKTAGSKRKRIQMKKYLGIVITTISLFLSSFTPSYSIDEVLSALRSGNAAQLSKYFDTRVDISLPNKSDNFSRNQAEMILKDFFASNEVKNFVVKHKGENNGSQFCIGLLQTRNGNYRTKLYMKQKGNLQVVQEIAFQQED